MFDEDGNGFIEFDELYEFMKNRKTDEYKDLFEHFDKNDDGLLSREEFI